MRALKIIIFVIVMGTVSSALLVGVNSYTAPRVAKNEELRLKSSVMDVFDLEYKKENIEEIFESKIEVLKKDGVSFYRAPDNAIAFEFHGPGLWGPISGIISFEENLKTIRKIKVLHQEETPGLGARIAEEEFLGQFDGKEVEPALFFITKGKAQAKNEVDAITGATGSSKAFEKLLNEAAKKYLALIRK